MSLRLMRTDEMRNARAEAQMKYGTDWMETLVLLQSEQIAELTKQVKELKLMATP